MEIISNDTENYRQLKIIAGMLSWSTTTSTAVLWKVGLRICGIGTQES